MAKQKRKQKITGLESALNHCVRYRWAYLVIGLITLVLGIGIIFCMMAFWGFMANQS